MIWEPFHQVSVAFTFLYPGLEFILRYVALTGAVKKLSPAGLWKILWSLFCCRLDPCYLLRKKYVAIDSLQKLHGINKASINTSILKVVIEILGTRLCLTVTRVRWLKLRSAPWALTHEGTWKMSSVLALMSKFTSLGYLLYSALILISSTKVYQRSKIGSSWNRFFSDAIALR